tara:strand:+ start:16238 stop:16627 length:390 start_codon:yes stop_codon:yes gene_type:complete
VNDMDTVFSHNGEDFDYDNIEEALYDAVDNYDFPEDVVDGDFFRVYVSQGLVNTNEELADSILADYFYGYNESDLMQMYLDLIKLLDEHEPSREVTEVRHLYANVMIAKVYDDGTYKFMTDLKFYPAEE